MKYSISLLLFASICLFQHCVPPPEPLQGNYSGMEDSHIYREFWVCYTDTNCICPMPLRIDTLDENNSYQQVFAVEETQDGIVKITNQKNGLVYEFQLNVEHLYRESFFDPNNARLTFDRIFEFDPENKKLNYRFELQSQNPQAGCLDPEIKKIETVSFEGFK